MSCPRDPSQITQLSPEGLATRRSIRINGNYSARERDEWVAGRETSSFVVPLRVTELLVTHTRVHTQLHVHTQTIRTALQLNNRPPVKQFLNSPHTHACVQTRAHACAQGASQGRSFYVLLH